MREASYWPPGRLGHRFDDTFVTTEVVAIILRKLTAEDAPSLQT